jgi:integrase
MTGIACSISVGPSGLPMSRHAITNKIARIARKARVFVYQCTGFGRGSAAASPCSLAVAMHPVLHRLMRHSSMQVTMDYYASTDDALQNVIKELR